jgi:hypothetical protein
MTESGPYSRLLSVNKKIVIIRFFTTGREGIFIYFKVVNVLGIIASR